ncbi:MAG: amino acid adenylation domain-containing protein [Chloroflexota bacterium]
MCTNKSSYAFQIDYWQQKLANLSTLDLPIRKIRPERQIRDSAEYVFAVSSSLKEQVHQFAQQESMSVFAILLAAFKALLYRYSGQTDIVVGTIIDGRVDHGFIRGATDLVDDLVNDQISDEPSLNFSELISPKQNYLALRTDLTGPVTFQELSRQVSLVYRQGLANKDIPFDEILSILNEGHDASTLPVFQLMFEWAADSVESFSDLASTQIDWPHESPLVDFTLRISESNGPLSGHIAYNKELFDADSIERVADHFLTLLSSGVNQPAKKITELELLSAPERDRMLVEWNQTALQLPTNPLLHHLFEQQTHKTPERIAACFNDQQWTYATLEKKSTALAIYLQEQGVKPGILVGIYMERSLEMLLSLLAILKAGGGYVPLDPAFPQDRLAYMVADSGIPLLLTQQELVGQIFEHEAQLVCVNEEWSKIEEAALQTSVLSKKHLPEPSDLAYVIYTSGSTGKPKGVQIPHIAACNFLLTMSERPGIDESDVLLAVTTLSFDIALLELFLPLTVGAKVVIASREVAADAHLLHTMMNDAGVTMMQATPATWRMLMEIGWHKGAGLKALCGGEPFPVDLAERLLECCDSVWNMYGPTETTVWSTLHQLRSIEAPISIGRPIANTEIYILDAFLQPVPIGIPGILYIGGTGVAQGYLNRPELTSEKFIAHPFREDVKACIYNTGDMARYLPDGQIECLGRIDHQVKVRGFRIELGEIETVLSAYPGLSQNAVIAHEESPGHKVLVAYLLMDGSHEVSASDLPISTPSVRELRDFLKAKLPAYMIPSRFVLLNEMPLTPNGKIDRLALPDVKGKLIQGQGDKVLPRDEVEVFLKSLFEEVLHISPVGIHDDYFGLGGTSIIAARLFSRIDGRFGRKLPLNTLLNAPTISQLANIVRNHSETSSWSCLVKIREGLDATRPPLFLFHGAGGAVLLYRELANQLDPGVTVYGLQAWGLNGEHPPHQTIEEMAQRYLDEIEQVHPSGPYQLAGYCMGGTIALEVAQRLQRRGHTVSLVALLETYNWSRQGNPSRVQRLRHQAEKVLFHLMNLGLSDSAGRSSFLKEKVDEARRRVRMAIKDRTRLGGSGQNGTEDGDDVLATASQIWEINDEAALLYQPQVFAGTIVHIRPRKEYTQYAKPELGWDTVGLEGVDKSILNVYPAGMLVEPFVSELASELNNRLVASPERVLSNIDSKKSADFLSWNFPERIGPESEQDFSSKV